MSPLSAVLALIDGGLSWLREGKIWRALQKRYPERPMTVIAAELHIDYICRRKVQHSRLLNASLWADAHYRPIPGDNTQLQQEAIDYR